MPLPFRALVLSAVAAGLVTAAPAVAAPAPAPSHSPAPSAHAAGGDLPPVIPAIVRTRIKRTESALDRLSGNVDDDDPAAVTKTGKVVRQQLLAAWRGVKYYIKNAPPPVSDEARVRPVRAHASGGAPALPVAADPPTVALAVFAVYDDAVSGIAGLLDGADAPTATALGATLTFALDGRDAAVADVHALPPDPSADDARVRGPVTAHAAGGAVVGTFATVMPQVSSMLDDELQQITALKTEGALQPSAKKVLRAAQAQILLTKRQVDAYWPPTPTED
jgi:hypothetical protein